jgi:hypothetical protein
VAGLNASGTYQLSGHDGPYALERFTCGATPEGWRYDATRDGGGRLELQLDGTTVRLHVEGGGWVLRGAASGGQALWRRGEQEHEAAGDGFTGSSPGFLLVGARLARARLSLVEVTEPVLATRATTQAWTSLGSTEHDGVVVSGWQVDDLATGERRTVRLAGDVVVEAPGVQLVALTRG